jgi:hypothetical protein
MAASQSWRSRVSEPQAASRGQSFHKPHSSLGATGHWIKTAGILAPLVIGEFVKDHEQRWRYIRIASVATALVSEGLYTNRMHREREQARLEHGSDDNAR